MKIGCFCLAKYCVMHSLSWVELLKYFRLNVGSLTITFDVLSFDKSHISRGYLLLSKLQFQQNLKYFQKTESYILWTMPA